MPIETFTEADCLAAPEATHRIVGDRAIREGEFPADGHEHVFSKAECAWLEWINTDALVETFDGSLPDVPGGHRTWPQAPITLTWDGDSVLWCYTPTETPALAADQTGAPHG